MVASSVLASLVVSAILSVVWPVAIFFICRRRMALAMRNVLVGVGVFQIALSLVVWRAVESRRVGLLALAVIFHAVIDFPAGLVQAGLLSTAVAEALLVILGAALVAFFLRGLPRKATPAHQPT
jgi:uncharacterized membrane protein YhfC